MNSFEIVLLAAGMSRRFAAGNKLLADVGGRAMVRTVADRLKEAFPGVRLIAVTGHQASAVRAALTEAADDFVHNADYASGIASSVAAGVRAVTEGRGAMIVQGDMPALSAGLLGQLAQAFAENGGRAIVFPQTPDGRQRTPVTWPADLLPELSQLTGDTGAKPLFARHQDRLHPVPVADEAELADLDTVEVLDAWNRLNP